MKSNQLKKLRLNKKTIANLNREQMRNVIGGDDPNVSNVGNIGTPCDLKLSILNPQICAGLPKHTDVCPPPTESDKCNG